MLDPAHVTVDFKISLMLSAREKDAAAVAAEGGGGAHKMHQVGLDPEAGASFEFARAIHEEPVYRYGALPRASDDSGRQQDQPQQQTTKPNISLPRRLGGPAPFAISASFTFQGVYIHYANGYSATGAAAYRAAAEVERDTCASWRAGLGGILLTRLPQVVPGHSQKESAAMRGCGDGLDADDVGVAGKR